MFGLEKEKEKDKKQKFQFDLEVDIHEKPKEAEKIIEQSKKKVEEIKKLLKSGQKEKDYEQLGILLHAYNATQRVIKKVAKS